MTRSASLEVRGTTTRRTRDMYRMSLSTTATFGPATLERSRLTLNVTVYIHRN